MFAHQSLWLLLVKQSTQSWKQLVHIVHLLAAVTGTTSDYPLACLLHLCRTLMLVFRIIHLLVHQNDCSHLLVSFLVTSLKHLNFILHIENIFNILFGWWVKFLRIMVCIVWFLVFGWSVPLFFFTFFPNGLAFLVGQSSDTFTMIGHLSHEISSDLFCCLRSFLFWLTCRHILSHVSVVHLLVCSFEVFETILNWRHFLYYFFRLLWYDNGFRNVFFLFWIAMFLFWVVMFLFWIMIFLFLSINIQDLFTLTMDLYDLFIFLPHDLLLHGRTLSDAFLPYLLNLFLFL